MSAPFRLTLLLLLCCVSTVPAQNKPRRIVAEQVTGKAGELIVIDSLAKGEVAWLYDARDFDSKHSLQVNGSKLVVTTLKPGTYSISIVAWDERKIQQILVIVEGEVPPPPPPPPPPPVDDALTKQLKFAWLMEHDPQRDAYLATLSSLFRQAANVTQDPNVKTVGDLFTVVKAASAKVLPQNALAGVRTIVSTELNARLPRDPNTLLDATMRTNAGITFLYIQTVLDKLKVERR